MVDKTAKRLAIQLLRLMEIHDISVGQLFDGPQGFKISISTPVENSVRQIPKVEIRNGDETIFLGKANMLTELVDENLCPRCEKNPIVGEDYLCQECRNGI